MTQSTDLGAAADSVGAVYRARSQVAEKALATWSAGASEPSPRWPNMLWWDLSSAPTLVKLRNSADTAWIVMGAVDLASGKFYPYADGAQLPGVATSGSALANLANANIWGASQKARLTAEGDNFVAALIPAGASADGDRLGRFASSGKNSSSTEIVFGDFLAGIVSRTAGSEYGEAVVRAILNGVMRERARFGQGLTLLNASGGLPTGGVAPAGGINIPGPFQRNGKGLRQFLATNTVTGTPTAVTLAGFMDPAFASYEVVIRNLLPSADDAQLFLTLTRGGTPVATAHYNYLTSRFQVAGTATGGEVTGTAITCLDFTGGFRHDSAVPSRGVVSLLPGAIGNPGIRMAHYYRQSGGSNSMRIHLDGELTDGGGAVDGLSFNWGGVTTFVSGQFDIYGEA